MADSFQPRFVDLVRNTTHTQGTGNFVLGAAVSGHRSFAQTVAAGESFYYSAIAVETPSEHEIGRGTMLSDGTISRAAVSGELTNFSPGAKTVALVAAAEWFNSVQAAGGAGAEISPAAHGAIADGSTDNHAALAAADTAAGGIQAIALPPGTYAVASDLTFSALVKFARGAKLKPAAGVNIHFAQGYLADDWNHCFDISATGASVTGDKAPGGYVTPLHFGADPTDTAIDDMPAIEAATEYATLQPIRDEYAIGFPVKFPNPGTGNYYLTKTRPIYIARTTHWFGETRIFLRSHGGVEIRGADGLDAVAFAFSPGGMSAPADYETVNLPTDPVPGIGKAYSAIRSRFSDLTFLPESGAVVRQGFVHNTVVFVDRCVAAGFVEAQFHNHAQTGPITGAFVPPGQSYTGAMTYNGEGAVWGNTNGSIYTGCYAQGGPGEAGVNGGSHGFTSHGSISGTVKFIGCDAAGNQGAGFLLNDNVGCELVGCHSAQNSWAVSHGGLFYIPIKYHTAAAADEPGVGANWQTYWLKVTASVAKSAWALGQIYHPSGGVNVTNATAQTTLNAHYSEGGIEGGIVARNMTVVVGGYGSVRAPWHGEFRGAKIIGAAANGSHSTTAFTGQMTPGDPATDYGVSLGAPEGFSTGFIMTQGDAAEDPANKLNAMRFRYVSLRGRYQWEDSSNANKPIWGASGSGFTGTGYGAVTQAYFWANGLYIADGSAVANTVSRIRTATSLAAITDTAYGIAVRGDIWLYTQPSPDGSLGAVCTTAGTIGSGAVMKEFGPIAKLVTITQAAYDALGTPDPDTYYFITA